MRQYGGLLVLRPAVIPPSTLASGSLKDTGNNSDLPVNSGSRAQLADICEAVLVFDDCGLVMMVETFVGWFLGVPAA